jgi:hypothetical protein
LKGSESRHFLRANCRFSLPRRAPAGYVELPFHGEIWSFILQDDRRQLFFPASDN